MGDSSESKMAQLVDYFLDKLQSVAEDEDRKESEGWVGKWTIVGEKGFSRVYEIRNGKFYPTSERTYYTGEVEMSDDTFLDLMTAAFHGNAEGVFADKYAKHAIRYKGEQWVVDSERFRKVLRRIGGSIIGINK